MRKFLSTFSVLGLALLTCAGPSAAQEISEDRIKELALEAILENPQIIFEAVAILEDRQRAEQAQAAAGVLSSLKQDPNAPTMGNPDGDVVVVEFFDYNCPYCRRAGAVVEDLIAADKNVKVIYREWPILGEGSVVAARASLAAGMQGKYDEFHWALMKSEGRASEASIMRLARELGMDMDKLQADMTSPAVDAHLAESTRLARALGFTGTPAFVVGDQIEPGMIPLEQLQGMVAATRAQ